LVASGTFSVTTAHTSPNTYMRNVRSMHIWSDTKPCSKIQPRIKHQSSFSLCIANFGECFSCQYDFTLTSNGANFCHFFRSTLCYSYWTLSECEKCGSRRYSSQFQSQRQKLLRLSAFVSG
jgi:hypothetical protein